MKKIFLLVLATALVLCAGCGRRNGASTSSSAQEKQSHAHVHEGCSHDHSHDHDHDAHSHLSGESHSEDHTAHAGHSHSQAEHVHGESCSHNHAGHDHAVHSHAEGEISTPNQGHSHEATASGKKASRTKKNKNNGKGYDPHEGHDHGSSESGAADPDGIVFPAAQAARTDFEVRRTAPGTFREVIMCGGQITAAQQGVVTVVAPVAGVVTPYDGRVMANTTVGKGQQLFRLSSGGLATGDAIAKARINFEQAQANYERVSALYADRIVSQSDYLQAQAAYLTAQAEYEPVKNSDGQGGAVIVSPTAGYITRMEVSAGDYVEMGQPLAAISQAGRMQLCALVSQRYFSQLSDVTDANFRSASSRYYTVSAMGGELYSAGRIVSAGSSLIPVVFEFDNDGTLADGAYVDVALLGRAREGVIALPLTAITEQQGLYYVYVQLDEECYSRREVVLGASDGISVEILSGVGANEPVVTRGAINVKMASASGAIPHGHTH